MARLTSRRCDFCQAEIIQHLIDLLKKQAHVTTSASRTTAVTLYDAFDEYSAITKDTLASAKALEAAAHGLSRQNREDREDRSWSRATLAVVALPLALGLGILIQQQFTLLAIPDPTRGWKDAVWARAGGEIAYCLSREDTGDGDCVIDVDFTPPPENPRPPLDTQVSQAPEEGTSTIPYAVGNRPAADEN